MSPYIAAGSTVLDVGAWDGLLGEALVERLGCRVLGVDVVDRREHRVPFRRFDGDRLPVGDGERFDTVLLLYGAPPRGR